MQIDLQNNIVLRIIVRDRRLLYIPSILNVRLPTFSDYVMINICFGGMIIGTGNINTVFFTSCQSVFFYRCITTDDSDSGGCSVNAVIIDLKITVFSQKENITTIHFISGHFQKAHAVSIDTIIFQIHEGVVADSNVTLYIA